MSKSSDPAVAGIVEKMYGNEGTGEAKDGARFVAAMAAWKIEEEWWKKREAQLLAALELVDDTYHRVTEMGLLADPSPLQVTTCKLRVKQALGRKV